MNHPFIQGGVPDVCVRCRRPELDHTSLATCEACPYVGHCDLYKGTFLLCPSCFEKEDVINNLTKDYQSPENQQKRVDRANEITRKTLEISKDIDASIITRADYFNAETKSISELKSVIDADVMIERKDYELYKAVHERYLHFKNILIEVEEKRLEITNNIKADQTYLNNLVASLTKEEQDKYKVRDINYKPNEVKVAKPKDNSGKVNLAEIKEVAKEHGIAPEILANLCTVFKLTPVKAVIRYKEMMSTVPVKQG